MMRFIDLSKRNGKFMDIHTNKFIDISTSLSRVALID